MADNTESTAKINFKQAIIVALITSVTTIAVTLISTKRNTADTNPINNTSDCSDFKTQVDALKDELDQSVSAESLSDISSRFFDENDPEQVIKDSLRNVVSLATRHLDDKSHYAYNLYLLKRILVNKPKGNINTRIPNDEPSTYMLIQKILKNIQIYTGAITGDRNETYQGLRKFQEMQNSYTDNYFDEENYGILGNKTYIALMEYYKPTN